MKIEDIMMKKITLLGNLEFCMFFFKTYNKYFDICEIITEDSVERYEEDLKIIPVSTTKFSRNVLKKYIDDSNRFIIVCEEDVRKYDDFMYENGLIWDSDYIEAFYIQSYFSHKIRKNMKNKDIWIFGAGHNGRYFYENNKDLNICGFISNYEHEYEFLGLPVLRPDKLLNNKENVYVVICSDAREEMETCLKQYGFCAYINYCDLHQYLKKLFVSLGTCQVMNIVRVLNYNSAFADKYIILEFFKNRYIEFNLADRLRMNEYGKICDVIFYGSDDFRDIYNGIVNRFYNEAVKIYLPFYYFYGQHMQMETQENKYAVRKKDNGWMYWMRGDKEINKLLEDSVDKETIINKISSDDYWSEEQILNNWKRSIKKVEMLDRISDLKILPFIQENYSKVPIFKDGVHFGFELLMELSNQIAEKLGIDAFTNSDKNKLAIIYDDFQKSVMPIYPCVAKVLKLSFVRSDSKYGFYHKDFETIDYIDFKEYAERYIEYVYAFKKMSFLMSIM